MTSPQLPSQPITSPYAIVANAANGATSGLSEFSSWTKDDWDAFLSGKWVPHFDGIGAPVAAAFEWINAIVSAFQGDLGPLEDLVGDVIEGIQASFEDLMAAFQGTYAGSDAALGTIQTIVSALRGDIGDAAAWIKDLIERITGQARATIEDALADALAFGDQLKTILSGGTVSIPLPNLAGAVVGSLHTMLDQIGDLFAGVPTVPVNSIVQGIKDWITSLTGWKSDAAAKSDSIIGNLFAAWFGSSSGSTGTTTDVTTAISAMKTAIINGWTVVPFTSTTANYTDFVGCKEMKVVAISSPSGASAGGNRAGGAGGIGGKHKAVSIDPNGLAGIDVLLGTGGAATVIRVANVGSPHTGAVLLSVDYQSVGGIATGPEGYAPSASHAGNGGAGGQGGEASLGNPNSGSAGGAGTSTADATGGAGGTSGDAVDGTPGQAGGSVLAAALVKCGGAGGGGGGGAGTTATASVKQAGNGGAGGFPGGAGGGGGGAYGGGGKVGSAGSPGAPCAFVMYK